MSGQVLVVDDDEDIRRIVRLTLELAGFTVAEAVDGLDAIACAIQDPPDAILLDVMMPRMDGNATVKAVRADSRLQHIPVLMLTARTQTEDTVEALRLGADDYVTKPFDPNELTARVDAMIRRAEQQRASSPLTGLPGNDGILRAVQRWLDEDRPCAVAYADIDAFKAYNDHYGFMRGDRVLQATAGLLVDATNYTEASFVGHVGGDDFVIICAPDDADQIAAFACDAFDAVIGSHYDPDDRKAGGVASIDRQGREQFSGFATLSIGIVTTVASHLDTVDALVAAATNYKSDAKGAACRKSRWVRDGTLSIAQSAEIAEA